MTVIRTPSADKKKHVEESNKNFINPLGLLSKLPHRIKSFFTRFFSRKKTAAANDSKMPHTSANTSNPKQTKSSRSSKIPSIILKSLFLGLVALATIALAVVYAIFVQSVVSGIGMLLLYGFITSLVGDYLFSGNLYLSKVEPNEPNLAGKLDPTAKSGVVASAAEFWQKPPSDLGTIADNASNASQSQFSSSPSPVVS